MHPRIECDAYGKHDRKQRTRAVQQLLAPQVLFAFCSRVRSIWEELWHHYDV